MMKTIRPGVRGEEVTRLQQRLNELLRPRPPLRLDGLFGRRTQVLLRRYQNQIDVGIDGIAGYETWRALELGMTKPRRSPSAATTPSAPWLAVARAEQALNVQEMPGNKEHPRIVQYHLATTFGSLTNNRTGRMQLRNIHDEVAWCSSFVNWCLVQVGIMGTESAGAASWLRWGRPCQPKLGAITVIYNATAAKSLSMTGYHVGFLLSATGRYYELLGGNQGNSVQNRKYPTKSWNLKGCRWPDR